MAGTPVVMYWLGSAAYGAETYGAVHAFFAGWFGLLCLVAWSFALCFHLCGGIRHLCWDAGFFLPIKQVYVSGYVMLAATVALWATVWVCGLYW
jgi:succinate dehydrogenase / fumarate reductase cytochrome b subunit